VIRCCPAAVCYVYVDGFSQFLFDDVYSFFNYVLTHLIVRFDKTAQDSGQDLHNNITVACTFHLSQAGKLLRTTKWILKSNLEATKCAEDPPQHRCTTNTFALEVTSESEQE
jgi:hypothetical protein